MFNTKRIKQLEAANSELKAANSKLINEVERLELDLVNQDCRHREQVEQVEQAQQSTISALQQLIDNERAKHKRTTEYLRGLKTAMDIMKGAM